jgi:hypothetical protein
VYFDAWVGFQAEVGFAARVGFPYHTPKHAPETQPNTATMTNSKKTMVSPSLSPLKGALPFQVRRSFKSGLSEYLGGRELKKGASPYEAALFDIKLDVPLNSAAIRILLHRQMAWRRKVLHFFDLRPELRLKVHVVAQRRRSGN